jgi:ADP-ribose pyrophosphatase YjhB (NUDIX family)
MLIKFLGALWKRTPGCVRRRVVRLGQRRFTVTAGALIFDDEGRILLLEHVFRPDSGWGIPGGFIGKGEQPEAALRRELREEIGLEVSDVELLFVRALTRPKQIEVYFRAKPIGQAVPCSFEIKRAEWFPTEKLNCDLSRDQRQIIKRALDAGAASAVVQVNKPKDLAQQWR